MKYDESNIKVLKGLEPVRKRPGMYIGSTDSRGLHHLVFEIFDNAIDEVLTGAADNIVVTLHKDNSISISDNGRGVPVGKNTTTGISTIDTVYTVLHAGGKFDNSSYKVSGGLHGVGASVVNALSDWMKVVVYRDNKIYESIYKDGGKIVQPSKCIGETRKHGTTVSFHPDKLIFKNIEFNSLIISERLREASFLFKNLKIEFVDEITRSNSATFFASDGLVEYIKHINANKKLLSKIAYFDGEYEKINVQIAFQFIKDVGEIIFSFANSVKTIEGGSHELGAKLSLTETVNEFAREHKFLKDKDKNFEGTDVREGLTMVISVQVPEELISYEGQTKNKLFTQEAKTAVQKIFGSKLKFWLQEHLSDAEKIVKNACLVRDARLAAKKVRDEIRKVRNAQSDRVLFGKLTSCHSKDPSINELFLVEGDSAGGSAKMGRDKNFQAILPLRGKVINAEKTKLQELLKNEEILSIISCLGTGISSDFDLTRLRYNKVIIMTDADTDGAHIQILLLTFFYRYMFPLIETGKIYIAIPPLYKIMKKNKPDFEYAWTEEELSDWKEKYKNYDIQRYKGLGEMNAEQLWETTMDPKRRKLIKINVHDASVADNRIRVLMGDGTNTRKIWINENVDFSLEEDE